MDTYDHPDDIPPDQKALAEHLRQRAEAMGCQCRPEITVDTRRMVVTVEHNPMCEAWRHPASNTIAN